MSDLVANPYAWFSHVMADMMFSPSAEPLCQKLPTYEEATTLPSYDEAEKLKADEAARQSSVERQEVILLTHI